MNATLIIWTFIGISFVTYFIVSLVYKKSGINNLQTALLSTNGLRLLNLKPLFGVVLFGILSYISILELKYLVTTIDVLRLPVLLLFLVVFFLSATVSYLGIKKENDIRETYTVYEILPI